MLTLLLVFLVGCDHATKLAARDALTPGRVITLIRGVLDLRYTENFDTAFSLTRGWSSGSKSGWLTGLAIVTMLVVVGIAYERRNVASRLELLGFTLVLAGALGNTLDRLARGYVVDFIHVAYWPVFNVADVLVVLGIVLMSLRLTRGGTRSRASY